MALQELTKRELAGLIAGAAAVNAVIGRISVEDPEEMPTDQIRQWEISALWHLEAAKDALALAFKRRLEAGATIQPGPYTLDPDGDTLEDVEDYQAEYRGGSFNCVGFNEVGWNDPTKTKKARKAGRRGRK